MRYAGQTKNKPKILMYHSAHTNYKDTCRIHVDKNMYLLIRTSGYYKAISVDNLLDIEKPLQPTYEELEYYKIIHSEELVRIYLECVNYYWEAIDGIKDKYKL